MHEYLTTRELADLLRIKERMVYALAANKQVPFTKATGKLLFPRIAIEQWLAQHAVSPEKYAAAEKSPAVLLGSHDPLLEWAVRESRCGLAMILDSSLDGLDRYANFEGIACGIHLYNANRNRWNIDAMEQRFSHHPVVLQQWTIRTRGLIMRAETSISSLKELTQCRIVPRQKESGSQLLLESLLEHEGVANNTLQWLTPVRSETDAALTVLQQKADIAFGLEFEAAAHQLNFVPIIEEQFDLLIDRRAWFDAPWQALMQFCRSVEFTSHASDMAGYSITNFGKVHFIGK